jgi:exonuclease III
MYMYTTDGPTKPGAILMSKIKIVSLNVQSVMNPARFDSLYNHIQSAEVDIALAQEAFLDEALAQELETRYPFVSIASNKAEGRGGVATIINKRTTEWSPINDTGVDGVSHIMRADQDGRLLVCSLISQGRPLVVANVYAPANPGRRQDWFKATAASLVERPLAKGCDIVGGDWNEIVTASDHHRHRAPVESRRADMMELIDRLGGENQLVDGWKEMHPCSVAFTFFRGSQGISRIDRIYIRSDWLREAKGWAIRPSGLQTDHHAATTLLCLPKQVHRGPGRWRLNLALLKLSGVMRSCVGALQLALGRAHGMDRLQSCPQKGAPEGSRDAA